MEGIVPQEKQDNELELAGIPFEAGIQIVAVLTYRQKERHLVATFVGYEKEQDSWAEEM